MAALRRSSPPRGPSHIGSADIMVKMPLTPSGPSESRDPARRRSTGGPITEGAGPGPASNLHPSLSEAEGQVGGSGRLPASLHAGAHRSPRTRRNRPGRDHVFPERLQQLRARGGRLSPHSHHHSDGGSTSGSVFPERLRQLRARGGRLSPRRHHPGDDRWKSGCPRGISYLLRHGHCPTQTGRTGRRRRGRPIGLAARASTGLARPGGARSK
jgi:hypothetical protein